MKKLRSRLKFLIKLKIITPLRSLLLFLTRREVNKRGWENRILIINMAALGDLVMFTSVLKHCKESLPGKDVYFLVRADFGIDDNTFGDFVHRIITVNHGLFGVNPLYASRFINSLRSIGFRKVVDSVPSTPELIGKTIAINLGAEEVWAYEGLGLVLERPLDRTMSESIDLVRTSFFPKFSNIVRSIDKNTDFRRIYRWRHYIAHYAAVFEEFTGHKFSDYATVLKIGPAARESIASLLKENRLSPGTYCVLNLGASSPHRRWNIEKFVEVAKEIKAQGIPIVLVGTRNEFPLASQFNELFGEKAINLVGGLSLSDLIALIGESLFVFTNDTSTVHIAVALQKASLCIIGGAHIGIMSLYGYEGLNRWVYKEMPCLLDNGQCTLDIPETAPAPCIEAVSATIVIEEFYKLLKIIRDKCAVDELLSRGFKIEFNRALA